MLTQSLFSVLHEDSILISLSHLVVESSRIKLLSSPLSCISFFNVLFSSIRGLLDIANFRFDTIDASRWTPTTRVNRVELINNDLFLVFALVAWTLLRILNWARTLRVSRNDISRSRLAGI